MQEPIMFGEGVFALCENLLQINFMKERKMNRISQKAFLNCQSIKYVGYDNLLGKVCWDDDKFAMDLPCITDFEYSVFDGYSKLESIKIVQETKYSITCI